MAQPQQQQQTEQPLEKKSCSACQKGAPVLPIEKAEELHKQLHADWMLRTSDHNPKQQFLNRKYQFKDFAPQL